MLPTWRGSNPQPPDHQSDTHPAEPPRSADIQWYCPGEMIPMSANIILNYHLIWCDATEKITIVTLNINLSLNFNKTILLQTEISKICWVNGK